MAYSPTCVCPLNVGDECSQVQTFLCVCDIDIAAEVIPVVTPVSWFDLFRDVLGVKEELRLFQLGFLVSSSW